MLGMKKITTLFVALVVLVLVSNARAVTDTATYTAAAAGNNANEKLDASVTFVVSNSDLVVTLANTSKSDPNDPSDILTGVFLDIAGDPKLTTVSADLAPGSEIIGHSVPLGFTGNVGGEWSYRNNLLRAPQGDDEGISSSSFRWFSGRYLFQHQRLPGARSLSGVQFGLTTINDLPGNNDGALRGRTLIDNSVVLTFAGLPADFTLSDISKVEFQYGYRVTPASELLGEPTSVISVPEPSTIGLVVAGLLGTIGLARRKFYSR
jgi:PEP-CTERM motif-containing protein